MHPFIQEIVIDLLYARDYVGHQSFTNINLLDKSFEVIAVLWKLEDHYEQ